MTAYRGDPGQRARALAALALVSLATLYALAVIAGILRGG